MGVEAKQNRASADCKTALRMASEAEPSRGIPAQDFIENVSEYCKAFGNSQSVIATQQEMYGKYKFMESQMAQHRNAVVSKKEEIEKSLGMLKQLIAKRDKAEEQLQTHFQLGSCLYAKANIPTTEESRVC